MRLWTAIVCVGCAGTSARPWSPNDPGVGATDTATTPAAPEACGWGPVEVQPGSGSPGFVPWRAGDPLIVNHAAGGWGIPIAGEVTGVLPSVNVGARVVAVDGGGAIADARALGVPLTGFDAGACQGRFDGVRAGVELSLRGDGIVCAWEGLVVDVTLTVSDVHTGARGASVVRGALAIHPDDLSRCAETFP